MVILNKGLIKIFSQLNRVIFTREIANKALALRASEGASEGI